MTSPAEILSDLRERMTSLEVNTRHMAQTLDRVLAEAQKTNGRVTRLEMDAAHAAATAEAIAAERAKEKGWRDRYIAPIVTGTLVGVMVAGLKLLGLS